MACCYLCCYDGNMLPFIEWPINTEIMRDSFRRSLRNIVKFGDTDIFPFPFERNLFNEREDECLNILEEYYKDIESAMRISPPLTIVQFSQVSYHGFRQATLIEPFWNAYYLGLVLSIADKIEEYRNQITFSDQIVFSYRYQREDPDNPSLFTNSSWLDFKRKCVEHTHNFKYVLQTDISNFYYRINHQNLERELKRLDDSDEKITSHLMLLLSEFSGRIPYGLPVGGPASRILAELALNLIDVFLDSKKVTFCRYADDYCIFCNSESEAYEYLIYLSENLSKQQLSLNKGKTKIMKSEEFRVIHEFFDLDKEEKEEDMSDEQMLLNLSIRFNPYSTSAQEDYENIKSALRKIDLVGILSKELNKTRFDQVVTKRAIEAINELDIDAFKKAITTILEENNLITLSPIFTTVIMVLRDSFDKLDDEDKRNVDRVLLSLFEKNSFLTKIDMNVCYMLQVLSICHTFEKESFLRNMYMETNNRLIKRQIIITMTNWKNYIFTDSLKSEFNTLTRWERLALIYALSKSERNNDNVQTLRAYNFTNEENLVHEWFVSCNKSINV
jgi:hypothetical protein